ncbi:MAG: glycosyltransferase family 39 protein [Sciscionella sp.]
MGKTALLQVVLTNARAKGWEVRVAVADELDSLRPFALIEAALGPVEAEVATLDVGAASIARPHVEAGVAETLIARAVALASPRPLVLALEDVQWADPASLAVVGRLARLLAEVPVLVLATARRVPRPTPLARLLTEAVSEDRRLALGALSSDAVAVLVGEAVGGTPGTHLLMFRHELICAVLVDCRAPRRVRAHGCRDGARRRGETVGVGDGARRPTRADGLSDHARPRSPPSTCVPGHPSAHGPPLDRVGRPSRDPVPHSWVQSMAEASRGHRFGSACRDVTDGRVWSAYAWCGRGVGMGGAVALGGQHGDPLPRFAVGMVGAVVAVQVAVLTALSGRYGFHRDELYFLAAGAHPAWGYVDQPPLTPLLARIATTLVGDSPSGLRVASTVVGAATVLVVALVARELGGGRAVQALSAAVTALSSFVLVVSHMVSTVTVDLLLWTVIGLLVLRLLRTGDGRWWVAVGAAVGVALANKWLVLLLVSALGVALLLVGPRAVLRSGWLAVGVGVAAVLAAPVVVWQAVHGFPLLTVAAGISADDGAENRILFVPMQLVYLSPLLVPVWVAGLVRLWRDPRLRWARALAVSYPVLCGELLVLGGKPYYSVPLLVLLTAAGVEPALHWLGRGHRASRRALVGAVSVVAVAVSVLIGLPVLPAGSLNGPVLAMNKEAGEQVGWPAFAATVARAWQQIPPGQRSTAVIFTRDYGQAGALERYGQQLGLPKPYSGHMSYADWGPPPDRMTGPVVLVGAFGDGSAVRRTITDCRVVAVNDNGIGLNNEEQGTPVALCAGPVAPWSRIWPDLRRFY